MVPAPLTRDAPRVDAIVIGGSAGSVAALGAILPALPADFPPVLVVIHILPTTPSLLTQVFGSRCAMEVHEAEPSLPIRRGAIYFAPSDYHLLVEPDHTCALSIEPPVHFSRPAIDVLFESAADVYGAALVGVVLTGASADGALGARMIHAKGGRVLIQDPHTAEVDVMPLAALAAVPNARVLPVASIADQLRSLVIPR